MDREALILAWATVFLEGKDKIPAASAVVGPTLGYDVELVKRKFEFEIARW